MVGKHWYVFEENKKSISCDFWDELRVTNEPTPFAIEDNIEEYQKNCIKHKDYEKKADIILSLIDHNSIPHEHIVSMGVGKGILEWHLKRQSPITKIICTDYTEKSLNKLKSVFVEMDDSYIFDIKEDDYSSLKKYDVLVFHRISTEFTMKEWIRIFDNIYAAGIKNVVFSPTGLDGCYEKIREYYRHYKRVICGIDDTFCGWLYSEKEFKRIFRGSNDNYTIVDQFYCDKSCVFLLTINCEKDY